MNAHSLFEDPEVQAHRATDPNDPFDWGLPSPAQDAKKGSHGFRRGQSAAALTEAIVGGARDPELDPSASEKKKAKAVNHFPRVRAELAKLGYFAWTVETLKATYSGSLYKEDCLGLFDVLAIKEGALLGVQVTSKTQVAAHLRKYADSEKKVQGQPIIRNLEEFLQHGGKAEIWGFYQPDGPGGRWAHDVVPVTMEVIEAVIARRRSR